MSSGHSVVMATLLSTQSCNNWHGGCRFHGPAKCILKVSAKTTYQDLTEKIRKRLSDVKLEVSPSAYDTAWVAMVPARKYISGDGPCFQQCLDWVMENQHPDGSWGLNPGDPSLVKDSLSCTLACVLALHKWNVGQRLVQRGLEYIGCNAWAATAADTDQFSPIGFNIVFPEMVSLAKKQDLTLPLSPTSIDSLLRSRDSEIRNRNVDYVAEGLGDSCNWKQILKHQRSNGSLFNSPATTAAALIHCPDDKCFQYLVSAIKAFDGWVPTVYPAHIQIRVFLVDTLERLGVARHFQDELRIILDEIYRSWMAKEEEIFSGISCLAMAFRLLRTNGYDVLSDKLAELVDEDKFFTKCGVQNSSVATCLELYRASHVRIYEEEPILEKIFTWTRAFLKQQLLNRTMVDKGLYKQVECDLRNFYGKLDRVGHRQSIELFDVDDFQMLKTAYRCPTIHNEDFAAFAAQDFRISQAQYREELKQMERWYAECNLNSLTQGRNVVLVSYMLSAGVMVQPELVEARISFAQCTVLVTVFDDLIDNYGSKEEAIGFVELVRNWNKHPKASHSSREVEIMFTALCKTINDFAEKAYSEQGRCIKHELFNLWLEMLTTCLRQKGWGDKKITTLDEYMSNGWLTTGVKVCICTTSYFLGAKISEDLFASEDFITMCRPTALICRLLNDIKSDKLKEYKEAGVLNSVSMEMAGGVLSKDEAILKMARIIENSRRKVQQILYQSKGNIVPRPCQELMWKSCKICYWLYPDDGGDEFTTPQIIVNDMNALMWEVLDLPPLSNKNL